jgi:PAS domain S-box-containing protein
MSSATTHCILVVDDDASLLRLMSLALRRSGAHVTTAPCGAEAIRVIEVRRPDLLLLDLQLPDVSGQALIEQIQRVSPGLPFIVITGQGDERVAVEMMKLGATDYLVKDHELVDRVPTVVSRVLRQLEADCKIAAAEDALRREHAFSNALVDTSGALVVALDCQGRIVRFNPACERATGYALGEVQGKSVWDWFILPEEMHRVHAVFDRLLNGETSNHLESRWRTRDGGERLIAWTNTALRDPEGTVEYVIASGLDVTEHRRLEKEILQISEMERRRLGHDLHDGLCQYLAAIELMSQALQRQLERTSQTPSANQAAQIAQHVREAIVQTRLLARGLSPVVVESEGLMAALRELASSTARLFRVRCQWVGPAPVLIGDADVATHLYRIAQEAVGNAVKHGQAQTIEIHLSLRGSELRLVVSDNGIGLPAPMATATPASSVQGMGLRIMQFRAAMIGANLQVQSPPGHGVQVLCSLVPPPHWNDPASSENRIPQPIAGVQNKRPPRG